MISLDRLAATVLLLEPGEEDLDDARVELLARALAQLIAGDLDRQRAPVDAVAGHRLVRVGHRQDACLERDLVAGQARGITAAVRALVVRAHPRGDVLELRP